MNYAHIIGLTGNKRCGKDTMAKLLSEHFVNHELTVAITHFSEPLKSMSLQYLPSGIRQIMHQFIIQEFAALGQTIHEQDAHFLSIVKDVFDGVGIASELRDKKFSISGMSSKSDSTDQLIRQNKTQLAYVMNNVVVNFCCDSGRTDTGHLTVFNDACRTLMDQVVHDWVESENYELQSGISIRDIEVVLGTYMRAWLGQDFWVDQWVHMVNDIEADIIIVKDIRMNNEAQSVCRMGGDIFSIYRDGISTGGQHAHTTEQGISHHLISQTIQNIEGSPELGADEIAQYVLKHIVSVRDLDTHPAKF